ncbi:hypothetical protein SAMN05216474_2542 [Lishizhenia tianjinensis]|uniref:Sporulation related domain-containing protein n=1 Tax=Lishizhenia tianjinensis TaxID=477690 RepID=A0A1I7B4D8_9FLAO|nr:hypothetical protein [Lishizhenia tianjinensis]SFT82073.1 hypothetical protein SAMN05216474_2542 [Lishizhenia tianjinensis]
MKIWTLLLSFLLVAQYSIGQNTWWNKQDTSKSTVLTDTNKVQIPTKDGEVTIQKDPRIDELVKFKGTTVPPAYGPQISGYRVQIFFDNDRTEVNKTRAQFIQDHKDVPTYIEFKAPNFNLKVGNCRTKLEAEKLKAELLKDYPTAIVIQEKIYLPKVENSEATTNN